MNDLTLDELYHQVKKMWEVEENRNKTVQVWFWSTAKQIGSCAFDKLGVVIDAGNYFESRYQTSTIPVLKIEER